MDIYLLVFLGALGLVFVILVVAFISLRANKQKVPETLPPLPTPPIADFKHLLLQDISNKKARREEIKAIVKGLEQEYQSLNIEIVKLEGIL